MPTAIEIATVATATIVELTMAARKVDPAATVTGQDLLVPTPVEVGGDPAKRPADQVGLRGDAGRHHVGEGQQDQHRYHHGGEVHQDGVASASSHSRLISDRRSSLR